MVKVPTDTDVVIDVYRRAADENRIDPLLQGSTLHFPDYGQVVVTGDMHGHLRNFDKLVKFCILGQSIGRHVILQELIHHEPVGLDELDMSHELLYEVAHWKCSFPEQVHFLQSNHELAQLTGQEVTKNGRYLLQAFEAGVAHTFGWNNMSRVIEAIKEFLSTLPLAARTPSGLFISHSLPSPVDWPEFDRAILDRKLTSDDFTEEGSIYPLVWGRGQTPELLAEMAKSLNVKVFIVGHQPQEEGFAMIGENLLVLASDHNHGVFLPINLKKQSYTLLELVKLLRRYVAVP